MDTKHKGDYASPTITVVEIKFAGVICASGDAGLQNYNPLVEQNW